MSEQERSENVVGAETPSDPPAPANSMADAAEMLWIVLANVSGGDWSKQSTEWQEAAARWRDNYFAALASSGAVPPSDILAELARHLSPDNENVRRGYIVAAIRDLAQVALSERGNAEDLERRSASLPPSSGIPPEQVKALRDKFRERALLSEDCKAYRRVADELDTLLAEHQSVTKEPQ